MPEIHHFECFHLPNVFFVPFFLVQLSLYNARDVRPKQSTGISGTQKVVDPKWVSLDVFLWFCVKWHLFGKIWHTQQGCLYFFVPQWAPSFNKAGKIIFVIDLSFLVYNFMFRSQTLTQIPCFWCFFQSGKNFPSCLATLWHNISWFFLLSQKRSNMNLNSVWFQQVS